LAVENIRLLTCRLKKYLKGVTMKCEIFFKHILKSGIIIALFTVLAFGQNTDLKNHFESEYKAWKTHVEETPFSSTQGNNEHMFEIVKLGVPVLPLIIEKMEKKEFGMDFILEVAVHSITKKVFAKEDWPEGTLGDSHTAAAMYIDWWKNGLKNTSNSFNQYYQEWKKYRDEKNVEEAGKKLRNIKNLGIAAIPLMVDKIKKGDLEFIKTISDLTDGNLSANASKDECISWWNKNRDKYTIIKDK
jgi:hypothetical protein